MAKTEAEPAPLDAEARRTRRPMILGALILAMSLAAIEGTIVATAMPSIAAALGGFALYGWVFSAYLLSQAVMTPIFGKLADLYGRKPMFISGIALFLTGSLVCGFAPSMELLVAFRLVQGIGAGGVLPIAVTLAGDLYGIEERGRIQGYVASVWGIASIVGPMLGGLIVHSIGWRWIFWINLPLGMVAIVLIALYLHETIEHHERSIDVMGAVMLFLGLSAGMLALSQASQWSTAVTLSVFGAGVAIVMGFRAYEHRARDPIVHFELFRVPLIQKGNLIILAAGLAMIGLIGFLPTYVQAVLDRPPLVAGFALSAMSVGWPIASVTAGRLMLKMGVRPLVRAGCLAVVAGTLAIALFARFGPVAAGAGSFVVGIGFGLLNTTVLVSIQSSVGWRQRGVATAGNMLMRSIGNALGAALLGGVLNVALARHVESLGLSNRLSLDSVRGLLDSTNRLAPEVATRFREALASSMHIVFWCIFGFAALILVLGWFAPDIRLSDGNPGPEEAATSSDVA